MDKNTVKAQCNEVMGKLKQEWAKLSANDFAKVKGFCRDIKGQLQKKCKAAKMEIEKLSAEKKHHTNTKHANTSTKHTGTNHKSKKSKTSHKK